MKWKNLLFEYLGNDLNKKYSQFILVKLLQANKRKGKEGEKRYIIKSREHKLEIKEEEIEGRIKEICEFIVKKSLDEGYNAIVVPFIISRDQAPNFYISSEKPKEEELWWWLYHLITGLHFGNYVINIANVDKEIVEEFRNYLRENNFLIFKEEKIGLDIKEMLSKFKVPKISLEEFIFGFLILAYFSNFLKEIEKRTDVSKKLEKLGYKIEKVVGINDESSLLIFVLSKQKKRVYIFPKLKELLLSWFDKPKELSSFLFSFYITDKSYRDLSRSLLNKFLYYFLKNRVNGELLDKLIQIKISYEIRKKNKIYGILYPKLFFSNL